ncbi:MAG: hypothetical protein ABL888_10480 [Pirellulaceae bacterium]
METQRLSWPTAGRTLSLVVGYSVMFLAIHWPVVGLTQSPVTVVLKNGSTLSGQTTLESLEFNSIAKQSATQEQIQLADVAAIVLGRKTDASELEKISRAIARLDSPLYEEREASEQFLATNSMLPMFRSMLESEKNHVSLEKRHRVGRILKQLDNLGGNLPRNSPPRNSTSSNFDVIQTKAGKRLVGKLNEAPFPFIWQKKELQIPFAEIQRILFAVPVPPLASAAKVDRVPSLTVSQSLTDNPAWTSVPVLNFNQDHGGNALDQYMYVDDEFVDKGVRFFGDNDNRIVVSDLSVASDSGPAPRSICVFDTTKARRVFDGVIRVSFCVPGMPEVPAAVNQVGFQLAWIDHPKDLLLEAYDALGNLIATVEAGGERTQFFGLQSSIPIARVQVIQNSHLGVLGREVDRTYALMNFRVSGPQPIAGILNRTNHFQIRLKSGDLLCSPTWQWEGDSVKLAFEGLPEQSFAFQDIAAITLPKSLWNSKSTDKAAWMVKRRDGTALQVNPGEQITSTRMPDWKIPLAEVEAFWSQHDVLRVPRHSDFEKPDSKVIVFPTCRLAVPEIKFAAEGLAWELPAAKVLLPEQMPNIKKTFVEESQKLVPDVPTFSYEGSQDRQFPSVWLAQPKVDNPPQLVLKNGEKFNLLETFSIKNIDNSGVNLTGPQQVALAISWDEIAALHLQ